MDCKKAPLDAAALERMLDAVETVWVTRGKKLLRLHPVEDREEIVKTSIGRSGNLRAPSLRRQGHLLVGYSADAYEQLLG